MKVLVTDITLARHVDRGRRARRRGRRGRRAPTGDEDELVELVRDADAILTCFAQVTPAVVARRRAAARHRPLRHRHRQHRRRRGDRRGIPVTNVPVYCTDEVAEHVLAMCSRLVRGPAPLRPRRARGDWSLATGLPTRRVAGPRSASSASARSAGRSRAARAARHGGHRPRPAAAEARPWRSSSAARSDFVSVHVPLLAADRGLVDAEFLRAMKPTAYLFNAAGALCRPAGAGGRARAARSPAPASTSSSPSASRPTTRCSRRTSVLATPHTAFYSEESIATSPASRRGTSRTSSPGVARGPS